MYCIVPDCPVILILTVYNSSGICCHFNLLCHFTTYCNIYPKQMMSIALSFTKFHKIQIDSI